MEGVKLLVNQSPHYSDIDLKFVLIDDPTVVVASKTITVSASKGFFTIMDEGIHVGSTDQYYQFVETMRNINSRIEFSFAANRDDTIIDCLSINRGIISLAVHTFGHNLQVSFKINDELINGFIELGKKFDATLEYAKNK